MDFPLIIEARREIEEYFDKLGIKYKNKNTRDILTDYFSITHKLIHNKKRKIIKSKFLDEKVKSLSLRNIVSDISKKFSTGQDINPHLSKSILKTNSHDFILNEWKLHHLHLTNTKVKKDDYFYLRSDYLLFVYIDDTKVYFIDIISHSDRLVFAKKDFIRIVRENWDDLHDKFLVGDGSMQLSHALSEEDIANYRRQKHGVISFTQVDDKTYMPGLGSMTSGHSFEAMRNLDAFYRQLWHIQSELEKNEEHLKEVINKKRKIKLDKLDFTLKLENGLFRLFETNSKSYIA